MLLTPALRDLLPPPYPCPVIGASNPGAGKSLASKLPRILHGGVNRAAFPRFEEELRKSLTSIILTTTGPVVVFDNVRDPVRSGTFESLLTEAEWSDRALGGHDHPALRNDRLWMSTANGPVPGGEMHRRAIEVFLDCPEPHPERRTNFAVPLPRWAIAHRAHLVWAVLTLARAWVVDGMPKGAPSRADSYGDYVAGIRDGILAVAGFDGLFDDPATRSVEASLDDEDLAGFLDALLRVFGETHFTVAAVVEALDAGWLAAECLPTKELAAAWDRRRYDGNGTAAAAGFNKSLGWYLSADRFAGGLKVERSDGRGRVARYRVNARHRR